MIHTLEWLASRLSSLESRFNARTSSFDCSPAAISGRPTANRLRTRGPRDGKATDYASEWAHRLRTYDCNSNFGVMYDASGQRFQIYRYDEIVKTIAFDWSADHRSIKSAFLVFGLCGYNMNVFLDHIDQHPIVLVDGELSPVGTAVSCHVGKTINPNIQK